VKNYAIERERGLSNEMEVFKYGLAARGHSPVEIGAQLRSTESRHSQRITENGWRKSTDQSQPFKHLEWRVKICTRWQSDPEAANQSQLGKLAD
jgi:hypothetical protein